MLVCPIWLHCRLKGTSPGAPSWQLKRHRQTKRWQLCLLVFQSWRLRRKLQQPKRCVALLRGSWEVVTDARLWLVLGFGSEPVWVYPCRHSLFDYV